MATVGENRPLRDQYNILLRELRALQEQYNRERPGIGQNFARDIDTFRSISAKTSSVLFQMEQLQKQNIQNPDLFDPQLGQGIEQNVRAGRDLITASEQVVRQAEQQQQQQTGEKAQDDQGSGAASAGVVTASAAAARDTGSSVQNPPVDPQQISADGAIQNTPDGAVPSNAVSSDPNAAANNQQNSNFNPAPPKIQTGSVAGQGFNNSAGASGGSQSPTPSQQSSATNLDNLVSQPDTSYVYMAYECMSTFSKGSFTQEILGAQIFFDLPTNSQDANAATRSESQTSTAKDIDVLRTIGRPGPTVAAAAGRDPANPLNLNPAGVATTIDPLRPSGPGFGTAKSAAPTSGSQSVSTGGSGATSAAGSTNVVQVSTKLTLKSGRTQRVSSAAEINGLFQQGLVSVDEAGAALFRLQTQTAAQTAQINNNTQLIAKD